MSTFVWIIIGLAVLGAVAFGGRVLRRKLSERTGTAGLLILGALEARHRAMNTSELVQATGRTGGMVISALKILSKHGFIASTSSVTSVTASRDDGRYAITSAGRKVLRDNHVKD